jgi:hypothetical protein
MNDACFIDVSTVEPASLECSRCCCRRCIHDIAGGGGGGGLIVVLHLLFTFATILRHFTPQAAPAHRPQIENTTEKEWFIQGGAYHHTEVVKGSNTEKPPGAAGTAGASFAWKGT